MTHPLAVDLDQILAATESLWTDVRGERLLLTGGTGFFGCWLLESFAWANDRLGLHASALVVTRRPDAFARNAPHLAGHPAIQLIAGDVRSFDAPAGTCAYVVHAATESAGQSYEDRPLEMFDVIVNGTAHTLDVARQCGARAVLLTSSGAVYGPQPEAITHLSETYAGGPDCTDPRWAYGEAKRAAEMLSALAVRGGGPVVKIARGFAFLGPYLPLDTHFAAGNFMRDALAGVPIRVNGDGTPVRSYLYAADLAIWLWTILLRGAPLRPYNVGSAEAVTVKALADLVARVGGAQAPVTVSNVAQPGQPKHRYVPDVRRAETELGLRATVSLDEAIRRTIAWHRTRAAIPQEAARP